MGVVWEHDQVQNEERSAPNEHNQRSNNGYTEQTIQDDQMTNFRVLLCNITNYIMILWLFYIKYIYSSAKHGRKGKVIFRSINDNDERRSEDVTKRFETDETCNSDGDWKRGGRPAGASVDVQRGPNSSPMIHTSFY